MQNKFFNFISKKRFWFSLQFLLILLLNLVGHMREGNTLDRIFGSRFGEAIAGFVATILGFPSGIYFLFPEHEKIPNSFFLSFVLPAIYYPIFFALVWYITKQKANWKLIALSLIIFMLLSFGGCSRIIEIPLVVT